MTMKRKCSHNGIPHSLFLHLISLFFFISVFSLLAKADNPLVHQFTPQDGAEVSMILWSSQNTKHALMHTYRNSVYMSTTGGVQWSPIYPQTGSTSFRLMYMNDDLVVLVGESSWLITDFGATNNFVKINVDRIVGLDFHPNNNQLLLVQNNKGELYLTENLKDFKLIASSVTSFEWSIIKQPDCFFYTTAADALTRYCLTDRKATVVLGNTTFVFEKENTLFVTSNGKLYISSDGVKFVESRFALSFEAMKSYNVLGNSSGTYLVTIVEQQSSLAYLFKSDSTGVRYSLSLPFVGNSNGRPDMEMVKGVEGVLLVNEVPNFDVVRSRGPPIKRTRISYNNGVDWSFLSAPPTDIDGRPIVCLGACHLHLHGYGGFPQWGPIYSTSTAIGIIIATGNIGTQLSDTALDINTYMSRDAGLTWQQIRKGSSIYEIGDHGGIILMVDNINPTTTVEYSLDEGLTWQSLVFDQLTPVTVKNIMIEPTNTGKSFILYGTKESRSVTYHLDFSTIHERNCEPKDYEEFTVNDGRTGQSCFLGRKVIYARKKRSAACFNAETARIKSTIDCLCTAHDFECAFGFEKTTEGLCIAVVDLEPAPKTCPQGTLFDIRTGYRKAAGDSCKGGLTYDLMISLPCPKTSSTIRTALSYVPTALIVIVVILSIAAIITCFILYRNKEMAAGLWLKLFKSAPSYLPLNEHVAADDGGDADDDRFNFPNNHQPL